MHLEVILYAGNPYAGIIKITHRRAGNLLNCNQNFKRYHNHHAWSFQQNCWDGFTLLTKKNK